MKILNTQGKELISTTYLTLDGYFVRAWVTKRIDRRNALKWSIWLKDDEIHFGVNGYKLRVFKLEDIESIDLYYPPSPDSGAGTFYKFSDPHPHGTITFIMQGGEKINARCIMNLYWVLARIHLQIRKYEIEPPQYKVLGGDRPNIKTLRQGLFGNGLHPEITYEKWLETLKEELVKLGLK